MFPCMLVGVCLLCMCAGWCLQVVELPTVLLELESRPVRRRGGLAQTVSLAPGAARRPPGGLGIYIGADDLPTTDQLATDTAR
jgi:hypothetical protein